MGRSSLSGQLVCVKCGDECECYVCIGTTTRGGEDPAPPERLPILIREVLYDLVDPTKNVQVDGDGQALARIISLAYDYADEVAHLTVNYAVEEDMDTSDAFGAAVAQYNQQAE